MGVPSGGLFNTTTYFVQYTIMLVIIFLNKGRIHVLKRQNNKKTVRIGVSIFNNTYFHYPDVNQLRKSKEDGESFLCIQSIRAWR